MVWHTTGGFHFKDMDFNQSCFSCCLHVALKNLGHYAATDGSIEADFAAWFHMQPGNPDLNAAAPTFNQIITYLGSRGNYNPHLYHAQQIINAVDELNTLAQIAAIGNGSYAVIMAATGGGHAQLMFRSANTTAIKHMNPNPVSVGSALIPSAIGNFVAASATIPGQHGLLYQGNAPDQHGGDLIFIFQ